MAKPTEQEKKDKKQEWDEDGKVMCQGKEQDVKITVKTKPNANGGYDTTVLVPPVMLSAKKEAV